MKFGKLADISQVNFSLPTDPVGNQKVLAGLGTPPGSQRFYIGCTGWSMPEWVGRVYPKGTKSQDFLKLYSRQFNTIEFNTTHYRIPTDEMVQKWCRESDEDFRFCPKVPQSISHSRDLGTQGTNLHLFTNVIAGLGDKLGSCFLQLPPYFGHDRLELLDRFLQQWPGEVPLAVEVRHESWFADKNSRRDLFNLLYRYSTGTVITDVAGRRDVLHMGLTSSTAMVRFVGNGLHPTDYERIDAWVERILGWLACGLQRVFFFPHEPDNILAPELARYLFEKIKNNSTIPVKGPTLLDEQDGEQMSLF